MDLQLQNKVALVTGASKGIGRAIALHLAKEGMHLAITARSQPLLDSLASEIQSLGRQCYPLPADLSLEPTPAKLITATLAHFGQLDLLVNNAGATQRGDFLTLPESAWSDGFALKFLGAVRLSRLAWPHLMKTKGNIINIAGVGGRTASADFTIGGAVNAALLNLTKALADRAVHDGLRVNAINPGSIQTDRLTKRIQKLAQEKSLTTDAAAHLLTQQQKLARFGTPDEVANLVAFLASPQAAYLQGALIDLDGGLTRTL